MAIKNILVSYNALAGADAAFGVAAALARRFDAHLTGLLSWGPTRIASALGPWVTPELLASMREAEAARRAEIATAFHARSRDLEREQPGKVHFLDLGGDADHSLMEAARVYDLVVMGEREDAAGNSDLAPHPDLVALRAGRPVLIAPVGYRPERLNDRAVLAWDGGRAAARAMADAMPLLEAQRQVTVFSAGVDEAVRRREGMDVVAHLARHGVQTDWRHVDRPEHGVAHAIRHVVEETGAGLLVMGAYERPRLTEALIGGTTRRMLANLAVPVLMAH